MTVFFFKKLRHKVLEFALPVVENAIYIGAHGQNPNSLQTLAANATISHDGKKFMRHRWVASGFIANRMVNKL